MSRFLALPFDELISKIGHDGSEIIKPELDDPLCRRAFMLPEVVNACLKMGKPLLTIETRSPLTIDKDLIMLSKDQVDLFLYDALLYGTVNEQAHAVHCQKRWIYDPNGTSYSVEEFDIYAIVIRIDQLCMNKLSALCQLPDNVREISATNVHF